MEGTIANTPFLIKSVSFEAVRFVNVKIHTLTSKQSRSICFNSYVGLIYF